ncbi:MAG: ribosome-associated translation inhibitor RaiA [Verrucomicrobium sp.]|nr:ribosome-associated translation inhibitor RaiA [Verrucomicrobium sp.]
MQIHISPRNLRLTAAIHQHAAEKIEGIENLGDIIAAHIVLVHDETSKPKERFNVKVHLAVPGPDIHADVSNADLYAALDKASSVLARQLRKRKTALVDKKRQARQQSVEKAKKQG